MSSRAPRRLLTISIWGSLALTVGVCALGIRMSVRQYHGMEGMLLDLEQRAAEPDRIALDQRLRELEGEVLDALESEAPTSSNVRGDDAGLARLRERYPFVDVPFRIESDGAVAAHGLRSAARPPDTFLDEPPPFVFQETVRLLHSTESLSGKRAALEHLVSSDDLDETWRMRAEIELAAFRRRHQEPEAAAESYRRIARTVAARSDGSIWPSVLHLCLAEAEAREPLARESTPQRDALRRAVFRGLAVLEDPNRRTSLVEEEFFVEQARELGPLLSQDLESRLARAARDITSARVRHTAIESVSELVRSPAPPPTTSNGARRTITRYEHGAIPTVWRTRNGSSGSGPESSGLAVGFQVAPDRLVHVLNEWLRATSTSGELSVSLTSKAAGEIVPLGTLNGDWQLLSLGKGREEWSQTLGRAQRPFLVASVLLAALGLTLAGGLLVFYRGVRREMALARMKTEFVANVSHELKTPLALIRLCSETLELGRLGTDEQRNKYYGVITRESERLTHLIGNVLNFASIEAGKKDYALSSQDLAPVLRQTLEAYFLQFREKGFDCSADVPEALPPVVADEESVAQAIINLLQNAVRYSTEEKTIHVRATTDASSVRISVKDQGIGISKEDQKRVWEDYYRTASARALGTRGSGLGLSLVQHIVRAHGGQVELASEPGAGSEFTLVLPIDQPDGTRSTREEETR